MGRREDIEEQLNKDYELLKKLEDRQRTETDPKLELRLNEDIKKVKQQIDERKEELRSLSDSSVPNKYSRDIRNSTVNMTFNAPVTGVAGNVQGNQNVYTSEQKLPHLIYPPLLEIPVTGDEASEVGADYTKLRDLLDNKELGKADLEKLRKILWDKREDLGWLDVKDIVTRQDFDGLKRKLEAEIEEIKQPIQSEIDNPEILRKLATRTSRTYTTYEAIISLENEKEKYLLFCRLNYDEISAIIHLSMPIELIVALVLLKITERQRERLKLCISQLKAAEEVAKYEEQDQQAARDIKKKYGILDLNNAVEVLKYEQKMANSFMTALANTLDILQSIVDIPIRKIRKS